MEDKKTNTSAFSRTELSLLLYFETGVVDYGGLVEAVRMNDEDFRIAKDWNEKGFVTFKRIPAKDLVSSTPHKFSHFVLLSENAWIVAHKARRERAVRVQRYDQDKNLIKH